MPEEEEEQSKSRGHLGFYIDRPGSFEERVKEWHDHRSLGPELAEKFPSLFSVPTIEKEFPQSGLSPENYPTYGDIGLEVPLKLETRKDLGRAISLDTPRDQEQIDYIRQNLPHSYRHENMHSGMYKAFSLGLDNLNERLRNATGDEKKRLSNDKKWLESYVERYGERKGFHTPIYALDFLTDENAISYTDFLDSARHSMAKEIREGIEANLKILYPELTKVHSPRGKSSQRIYALTGEKLGYMDRPIWRSRRNFTIAAAQGIVKEMEMAQDILMPYIPAKYLEGTPFARTENKKVPKAKSSLLNGL